MNSFTGFAVAALLFAAPLATAHAAEPAHATKAEAAGAALSNSGMSTQQWVSRFAPQQADTQTARNERPAAPRS